jgi:hypothetical protein
MLAAIVASSSTSWTSPGKPEAKVSESIVVLSSVTLEISVAAVQGISSSSVKLLTDVRPKALSLGSA